MRKIFISYRRADTEYAAGALGRELRRHFGMNRYSATRKISAGGRVLEAAVLHEIDRDAALLVLISAGWANIKDSQGVRRLDSSDDPIRLEIADGIHDGASIIPVLP